MLKSRKNVHAKQNKNETNRSFLAWSKIVQKVEKSPLKLINRKEIYKLYLFPLVVWIDPLVVFFFYFALKSFKSLFLLKKNS